MSAGPAQRFWRWSRRKLEAKAAAAPKAAATAPGPAPLPPPPELPPVEALTFDSDFAAFLRPEVDDKVKRAALKQLFRDPRFNVMDGLDTYLDDYTKADPIAPDVLAGLLQRGFGRAPEAGPEMPRVVSGPQAAPAVTAATPPALPEGVVPGLPPEPRAPPAAAGAGRGAGEPDRPVADEGLPDRANPTDARQ
jgi:hypothetical protein